MICEKLWNFFNSSNEQRSKERLCLWDLCKQDHAVWIQCLEDIYRSRAGWTGPTLHALWQLWLVKYPWLFISKYWKYADSYVGMYVTETRELDLLKSPGGKMFQEMLNSLHISYVGILTLFQLQARDVILVLMTWLQFCSWRMARSLLLWYAISLQSKLMIIR